MKTSDRELLREKLSRRLASLTRSANVAVHDGLAVQDAYVQSEIGDEADEAQRVQSADIDQVFGERDALMAQRINEALKRLDSEDFGVCVDCGEEIEIERLTAVPWATRCTADQEAFENQGRDISPSL